MMEKVNYSELRNFLLNDFDDVKFKSIINNEIIVEFLETIKTSTENQDENVKPLTFYFIEKCLEKFIKGNLLISEASALKTNILRYKLTGERFLYKIYTHIEAMESLNGDSLDKPFAESNSVLLEFIKGNKKVSSKDFIFPINKENTIKITLGAAAVFLVLFLAPIQFEQNLNSLYNFDEEIPVGYYASALRGATDQNSEILHEDYRKFQYSFKNGMADYLSKDYKAAVSIFEISINNLSQLKKIAGFKKEDEQNLYIYNAFSHLALSLSNVNNYSSEQKQLAISSAIKSFQSLPIENDTSNYYLALSLALNHNSEMALSILSKISSKSHLNESRIILEEQIKNP